LCEFLGFHREVFRLSQRCSWGLRVADLPRLIAGWLVQKDSRLRQGSNVNWRMKMRLIIYLETSGTNHQERRRNIPWDRRPKPKGFSSCHKERDLLEFITSRF